MAARSYGKGSLMTDNVPFEQSAWATLRLLVGTGAARASIPAETPSARIAKDRIFKLRNDFFVFSRLM